MPYLLSQILPVEFLPPFLRSEFNRIEILSFDIEPFEFGEETTISLSIALSGGSDQLSFDILDPNGLRLLLDRPTKLKFEFRENEFACEFELNTLTFILPTLFKKVNAQGEALDERQTATLTQNPSFRLRWSTVSSLQLLGIDGQQLPSLAIPMTMIGSTGILFSIDGFSLNINQDTVFLLIEQGKLRLPRSIVDFPEVSISNCVVSNRGFSGDLKLDWDLQFDESDPSNKVYKMGDTRVSLFNGFTGGLDTFSITFEDNAITASAITGELILPYFEREKENAIAIFISLSEDGTFSVQAKAKEQPIEIKKNGLVSLYLNELGFQRTADASSFNLSGGLEPLLFSAEGMKWPRMDIKDLSIDSNGKLSIGEAWLDLKDMATLDLFGFHMELRKIGIGTAESDTKLWVDLSGGVKLVEQIPIGIDVEGFRIIWPQNLSNATPQSIAANVGIQFKGVQFSFGVPGALQIDGLIRFFKDANATGFAGDMVLVIPPAGITAEAGLLVGMNTEPDPYAFFYVYFGLESAAGIPLGQSGLALKGAMGLFGINVAPDKLPEQNWYYDWYKRAPAPGAHQTTKWTYQRDSLAVGVGVTITTVDGVVKGTKGIIVLALPGPILVINGKALVLDVMKDPTAEPPFSATAVFDGNEKIVQFNVEAQAEIVKDLVDAHAGIEAFFDFKDLTNWHLYLGQDQPEDRRIRANVLNMLEADAYLMLDMADADSPRARMGVAVSLRPKIDPIVIDLPLTDDDPEISFRAHLDLGGKGEVSVQPEQFSGEAYIDAGIEIRAIGIEVEVSAEANLAVEGPAPFSIEASLHLEANLPDPLPDYHGEFDFELQIPKVELEIKDPLLDVSLFSRFKSESKQLAKRTSLLPDSDLPTVPLADCDVNPVISFEHEMNQDCNFVMHPGGDKTYETGIISFTPTLQKVIISEKKKSGGSWVDIYSTANNSLPGVWLIESDPSSPGRPASRRLQLLTTNALSNTAHANDTIGFPFMQAEAEQSHLSERLLEAYPNLLGCPPPAIKPVCLEFRYSKKIEGKLIKWRGLQFKHSTDILSIHASCLHTSTGMQIVFPERIVELRIEFCVDPGKLTATSFIRPAVKDAIEKAKSKKENPDFSCSQPIANIIKGAGLNMTIQSAGFDCITLGNTAKGKLQVKKICYITLKSKKDHEKNVAICAANETLLDPPAPTPTPPGGVVIANNLFNPGAYYRITVQTKTRGEINNESDKGNAIINLYADMLEAIADEVQGSTTSYAYFQTAAPPENISAYIKWSFPHHQQSNIYKSVPFFIRFKREYLNVLYGNEELLDFKMQIFLKDPQGNLQGGSLTWLKASSYTYFPDEQCWRSQLGSAFSSTKRDDILKISFLNASFYKPNSRYELIITGARDRSGTPINAEERKLLRFDDRYYRILHTQTFQTSRFETIQQLFGNVTTGLKATTVRGNVVPFDTAFQTNLRAWAEAEMQYHITTVDYEYGLAKHNSATAVLVSKEAVEAKKILLSVAKEKVDTDFRAAALGIAPDLAFKTNNQQTEIYFIETGTGTNARIDYIWIQLPESIHLKIKGNSQRFIGKASVDIVNKSNGSLIASTRICNTDCSKLIFKLTTSVTAPVIVSTYHIRIMNEPDPADDTRETIFETTMNNHHRYDRRGLVGINIVNFNLTTYL